MGTHAQNQPLCAAYVRVSTDEQDATNQRPSLERLCAARGWDIRWYEETASAAKERPVLDRMLADAHRGEVQAVAVCELLIAIFGWVAEQERRRLIERTNEGIARARLKGTVAPPTRG